MKKPLQPPYNGPYRVIKQTVKSFVIEINGKQDSVSIDRLKVAFTDPVTIPFTSPTTCTKTLTDVTPTNESLSLPMIPQPLKPTVKLPETRKTRSGRPVHWPTRFIQFLDLKFIIPLNGFKLCITC